MFWLSQILNAKITMLFRITRGIFNIAVGGNLKKYAQKMDNF